MPSTYSSSLRLELQATGENANTWGTKTNNNLELIEQAIAGYVKITLTSASATYPLTIADASASDGRNAYIEFVGTVASAISITVPDVEKGYWVKNSATGSPLTFRTSSGTGVVLPTNQWVNLVSDGASITSTFPTSITGYALLSATQTFTGANTFTSLVNIQSATSLASTLVTNGNATFNSNVSVSGTFLVSGVTTLASAVDIKGATSLASTLVVGGAATFNSKVSVSGVMVVGAGAVGAPSYSTTGDTNTGIYFPAADTIAVATSGTERMRITSAGDVGIGTSSPTFKFVAANSTTDGAWLYSSGAISILGLGGYNSATDGAASLQYDRSAGAITINGGNRDTLNERMRIDGSGNVGIGTSSPGYKLDVVGVLAVGSTIFTGTGVSTGDVALELGQFRTGSGATYIDLHSVSGSDYEARFIRNGGANGNCAVYNTGTGNFEITQLGAGDLYFATNSVERMRVDSNGNVRVGAALATTATNGFLYVPTCAGTPTGTPTAITGLAPIVINTTNNKLYFYSGGAWRDAGP